MTKSKLIVGITISLLVLGCSSHSPHHASKKKPHFSLSNNHHADSGMNKILINETTNGNVRQFATINVLDKNIPSTVTFDACKYMEVIPVYKKTNNGKYELLKIDGKNYYKKNNCISKLKFTRTNNGNYVEGNITKITGLEYDSSVNRYTHFISVEQLNKQELSFSK